MAGKPRSSRLAGRPKLIYGVIFVILAAVTSIEVGLSSPDLNLTRSLRDLLLLALSLTKASLVAAFYMHLRKDSRLYTYVFVLPAILLLIFAYLLVIS
jgi:cytochrome c oxidase subunit 4